MSSSVKNPSTKPDILILGAYRDTDAYPTVKYRIASLQSLALVQVKEINLLAQAGAAKSWNASSQGLLRRLTASLSMLITALRLPFTILRYRKVNVVYLPYPALLPALWYRVLAPLCGRPQIVIDGFISLYDTIVNDRQLLKPKGLSARLLKRLEAQAFSGARVVLTDTPENSACYASLFGLPPSLFAALPLPINEAAFAALAAPPASADCTPTAPPTTPLRVLYIGTFVPLHGFGYILDNIKLLDQALCIDITFIGNGQEAALLQDYMRTVAADERSNIRVHWERNWQSTQQLLPFLQAADVCLGIFGSGAKAQRVWPFKNYIYLCAGKALITASTTVTERLLAGAGPAPFLTVDIRDQGALAATLTSLCSSGDQGAALGKAGNALFRKQLAGEVSAAAFLKLMTGLLASGRAMPAATRLD